MNKSFAVLLLPFPAALVAIVLSGCAAKPIELRQKPPEVKLASSKSSKQIAACIVEKWQHVPFTGTLISRTTAKGYTVIQNANGGVGAVPAFISDINDTPTGSETIFYAYQPSGNSSSYFQDSVRECQ